MTGKISPGPPTSGRLETPETPPRAQTERVWPVVNRDRCLGDGDCAAACPHGVLAMRTLRAAQIQDLPQPTRSVVDRRHGQQAHAVATTLCDGCGLCVAVCRQKALHVRGRFELAEGSLKTLGCRGT